MIGEPYYPLLNEVGVEGSGARGSRTLTTLRSGDFKSPASTIPPSPQIGCGCYDSIMLEPFRQSLFSLKLGTVATRKQIALALYEKY